MIGHGVVIVPRTPATMLAPRLPQGEPIDRVADRLTRNAVEPPPKGRLHTSRFS